MDRRSLSAGGSGTDLTRTVLELFEQRLRDEAGPIVRSEAVLGQTLIQARNVLAEILSDPGIAIDTEPETTVAIGTARAMAGVHPVHSVRAADLFYEVALPVILVQKGGDPCASADLATRLHRSVTSRVTAGAIGYVDTLIRELSNTHVLERQRMARELHDEIAHAIGVALQTLETWTPEHSADIGAATVATSAGLIRVALDGVRQMASSLRTTMDDRRLETALEEVLNQYSARHRGFLHVTGDTMQVPPSYRGEIFLAIREAMRNALTHAPDSTVQVVISVSDELFSASVSDDGPGLGAVVTDPGRGLGLLSMRERVELLDGTLHLTSSSDGGTEVSFQVPLPDFTG